MEDLKAIIHVLLGAVFSFLLPVILGLCMIVSLSVDKYFTVNLTGYFVLCVVEISCLLKNSFIDGSYHSPP